MLSFFHPAAVRIQKKMEEKGSEGRKKEVFHKKAVFVGCKGKKKKKALLHASKRAAQRCYILNKCFEITM